MLEPAEASSLAYATASIVHHEQESIKRALLGYPEMLNDFLEHCSLTRFLSGEFSGSQALHEVLAITALRLKEVGLNDSSSSLTTRLFGGVYFSYSQAVQLDELLDAVFSAPFSLRDLLLAAVLSTASEIVNTIGKQFAQPIRPKDKQGATKPNLLDKIQKDRSASVQVVFDKWVQRYQAVTRTRRPHIVIRSDYAEALLSVEEDTRGRVRGPAVHKGPLQSFLPRVRDSVTPGQSIRFQGSHWRRRTYQPRSLQGGSASIAFLHSIESGRSIFNVVQPGGPQRIALGSILLTISPRKRR